MFRQVELRSDDHRLMCWLPHDARLRPDVLVTLQDHPEPDRYLEIVHMHHHVIEKAPYQPWRVGGLL